jgi:hypothetical protein
MTLLSSSSKERFIRGGIQSLLQMTLVGSVLDMVNLIESERIGDMIQCLEVIQVEEVVVVPPSDQQLTPIS